MTKITRKRREKSATVHSGGKAKFPVDSPHTAESAAHLLNNAKPPLSSSERSHVMAEVHKYLPNQEAPPPKGSKSTPKNKNK